MLGQIRRAKAMVERSAEEADLRSRNFWKAFRTWRMRAIVPILGTVLLLGAACGLALALAFVIEQVVWMSRGEGQPCVHCGAMVRLRTFHLTTSKCPHCGKPFDVL
jgi:hypothetical protein